MDTVIHLDQIIDTIKPIAVHGPRDRYISTISGLQDYQSGNNELTWVASKNIDRLSLIFGGTVICGVLDPEIHLDPRVTYLFVEQPRKAFMEVISLCFKKPFLSHSVENSSFVAADAKIGCPVSIGRNVVVESKCVIGDYVQIGHNTIIKSGTIIGNRVTINANTVIGGDGFGYEKDENGQYTHIPHLGCIVIGDDVDIGSNTCIDRAVLGKTIIGNNVKIDNLVHIAHGVKIGQNSLIIAGSIIGGSTVIGKNVWIAPGVKIKNGVNIGDEAILGMGTIVLKDVKQGEIIVGNPGRPQSKKHEE